MYKFGISHTYIIAIHQCLDASCDPTSYRGKPTSEMVTAIVMGPMNRSKNPMSPLKPMTT